MKRNFEGRLLDKILEDDYQFIVAQEGRNPYCLEDDYEPEEAMDADVFEFLETLTSSMKNSKGWGHLE